MINGRRRVKTVVSWNFLMKRKPFCQKKIPEQHCLSEIYDLAVSWGLPILPSPFSLIALYLLFLLRQLLSHLATFSDKNNYISFAVLWKVTLASLYPVSMCVLNTIHSGEQGILGSSALILLKQSRIWAISEEMFLPWSKCEITGSTQIFTVE